MADKKEKSFRAKTFAAVVKKGGKLVSKEQGDARREICRGCEYEGRVHPLPGLDLPGCTECGCPFITKPYMETFLGSPVECPHPIKGNLWEEVDKNFNNPK